MADLTELQAAQTVKIAGANASTGIEDNFLEIDSSGRIIVAPLTNSSIIKVQLQDNAGTGLTSTLVSSKQSLDVNVVSSTLPTGIATFAAQTDKSQFTKLTDGTDTVTVSTNGDLATSNGLSNGGVNGNLSLTTLNTAYEAKVGVSRLTNRKLLTITALDSMYWGFDNTVTTSNGIPLYKDQVLIFDIDPDSTFQIWLIASASTKNARIAETP